MPSKLGHSRSSLWCYQEDHTLCSTIIRSIFSWIFKLSFCHCRKSCSSEDKVLSCLWHFFFVFSGCHHHPISGFMKAILSVYCTYILPNYLMYIVIYDNFCAKVQLIWLLVKIEKTLHAHMFTSSECARPFSFFSFFSFSVLS